MDRSCTCAFAAATTDTFAQDSRCWRNLLCLVLAARKQVQQMDRSCAMPPMRTRLLLRLLLWCRHPQAQQCHTPRILLPAHLLLLAQSSAVGPALLLMCGRPVRQCRCSLPAITQHGTKECWAAAAQRPLVHNTWPRTAKGCHVLPDCATTAEEAPQQALKAL